MNLPFTKYQGTGNDFILIDNRNRKYDHLDVAKLCHPKFGIGGDGLMLLQESKAYDFEMVYYNSDGNISSMCGNGGRCIVDFAKRLKVFEGERCAFLAIDGPHEAIWFESEVELQMKSVDTIEARNDVYVLDTGSPHYVIFKEAIQHLDILSEAKAIRNNAEFKKEGINVNFVELVDATHIKVRTYERGVENETLSCGTGVTASAIALSKHVNAKEGSYEIQIETPGGNLKVKFRFGAIVSDVWLCGAATMVYEGAIEI